MPIEKVMSAPARSVTADLTADTLLMEMLECGLRHMPVLTSRGEVVGVLEDADLLAASARRELHAATLDRLGGQRRRGAEGRPAGDRTGWRAVPQRDEILGDERDSVGGDRQPGAQGSGTGSGGG